MYYVSFVIVYEQLWELTGTHQIGILISRKTSISAFSLDKRNSVKSSPLRNYYQDSSLDRQATKGKCLTLRSVPNTMTIWRMETTKGDGIGHSDLSIFLCGDSKHESLVSSRCLPYMTIAPSQGIQLVAFDTDYWSITSMHLVFNLLVRFHFA